MLDTRKAGQPLDILLVENNPGGVHLAVHALKESAAPSNLVIIRDGEEAEEFLHRGGPYAGAPSPDLVIVNLDLPGGSGLMVLDAIRQDPDLRGTPVVALSTTQQGPQLLQPYTAPSNRHAGKPIDVERFAKIVESIVLWFALAQPDLEGYWGGLSTWNGRVN
ncbi:MAG: response regulator [Anaerolineae bacterium]|jgi:CheY-like chemotaxis protein